MASYLHPGVYIEEIPIGSRAIESVGTSTACFIGYTTQGPLSTPTLISNFDDYTRTFGPLREDNSSALGDAMGLSISAFFLNGGDQAYIVRLVETNSTTASMGAVRNAADTADLLIVNAINPGAWADGLRVRFRRLGPNGDLFTYRTEIGRLANAGDNTSFTALENLGDLSVTNGDAQALLNVVNGASRLVRLSLPNGVNDANGYAALSARLDDDAETLIALAGGDSGDPPSLDEYQAALTALLKVRDINILLLPGQQWAAGAHDVYDAAIAHCEDIRNRMVIVDIAPTHELTDEGTIGALDLPTSTYAVTYYPWVRVNNPFYNPDSNPAAPRTVLVSPAAIAAGLWAKTDSRRGVWKAPAGIEFPLLGVSSLEYVIENPEQDFLNPSGVNPLRRMPGFGPVVWGARTRSTRANPEWRYVPVRRTALFIEESIFNGIQWSVFEPNDHRLWSSLRANIESFMNGLFRVGAFQGEKATDAYFVRCGLGQTMTQDDIDRGQVIVLVGFAPLKPAEFVIVRIQQKVAQQ